MKLVKADEIFKENIKSLGWSLKLLKVWSMLLMFIIILV